MTVTRVTKVTKFEFGFVLVVKWVKDRAKKGRYSTNHGLFIYLKSVIRKS